MIGSEMARLADPDNDEFDCEECGVIGDIDDSIRVENRLLCPVCSGEETFPEV